MGDHSSTVIPVTSAYSFYQKEVTPRIKQGLLDQGGEASFGNVAKEISRTWKALAESEKEKYLELNRKDRKRYNEECEARDRAAEAAQAARRAALTEVGDGPRARQAVDRLDVVQEEKRVVHRRGDDELTEEELERKRAREAARAAQKAERRGREAVVEAQAAAHRRAAAEQAEARLKFLLQQSDIFQHFGAQVRRDAALRSPGGTHRAGAGGGGQEEEGGGLLSPAKHRQRAREDSESADAEDVKAAEREHTFLLRQPALITGGTLRPYQLEGLNWMVRLQEQGVSGVLADEMGLGKTLQSISILAYMREYKNVTGPHLVLLPKSTLSNWMNEFKRFCPAIRVVRFHGNKEERKEIMDTVVRPGVPQADRQWDVLVTTYEMANVAKNDLAKLAWSYLVIDEAHRLKNEASTFSRTVRELNVMHRLLLTGTPLQNNLHELWALLNFLLPDVFSSSEQFDEWFNLDVDDAEAKRTMIQQLHKILRPFMLRRLKSDVEKALPPKKETILFTGLSALQKQVYKQCLLRDIDTVNSASAGSAGRTAILNIVMQLRKCCNHPYLFPNVEDRTLDPLGEHVIENCGKMVLLDKLLRKLKERGHRVLIFSQMTRTLDILEDMMHMRGYQYCRIDGDTSYDDREDMIDEYNREGSGKFVFLLSTRAGGLGINLQTADTCILYDSDWNPQADLQAQDRCHRIGQTKRVHVYRLVTQDTIEEKVVERAQKKLKLDAMVVQQGRLEEKGAKLAADELLDALRFGADKVFRSGESGISDEDIDAILARGEQKTDELMSRLEDADKGDLMDFKLDGGGAQQFEGVDYSDKRNRAATAEVVPQEFLVDVGKRERRTVRNFANETYQHAEKKPKKKKVPKHLRLPKHLQLPKQMHPCQFFQADRLEELQQEEEEAWRKMVENDKDPKDEEGRAALQLLDEEGQAEKAALLAEGFGGWQRGHLAKFVAAAAKHGRECLAEIAQAVGKPEAEVGRYAAAFWERGPGHLGAEEWGRLAGAVERGEARLREGARLRAAADEFLGGFEDPWTQATFRRVTPHGTGRTFTEAEDRLLLCLARRCGYGADGWDALFLAVRAHPGARFDYYLRALGPEELGRRAETLMGCAARELEAAGKREEQEAGRAEAERAAAAAALDRDIAQQEAKLKDLVATLEEFEKKAKETAAVKAAYEGPTQAEIAKFLKPLNLPTGLPGSTNTPKKRKLANSNKTSAKGNNTSKGAGSPKGTTAGGTGASAQGQQHSQKKKKQKKDPAAAALPQPSQKKKKQQQQSTLAALWRKQAQEGFPAELLPNLVQYVAKAGAEGTEKVVGALKEQLGGRVSGNMLRKQLAEAAVKEKRSGEDSTSDKMVWYIKDDFKKYLEMPLHKVVLPQAAIIAKPSKKVKTPNGNKSTPKTTSSSKRKASTKQSENASSKKSKPNKGKGTSRVSSPGGKKRKLALDGDKPKKGAKGVSEAKKKKTNTKIKSLVKPRTAFLLWSSEHKDKVLRDNAGVSLIEIANLMQNTWASLSDAEREPYVAKAQADADRYNAELKFQAAGGAKISL